MPYSATSPWPLSEGQGWKTVHAQLRDAAGNVSTDSITDAIALDTEPLVVSLLGDPSVSVYVGKPFTLAVQVEGAFGDVTYEWTKSGGKGLLLPIVVGEKDGNGSQYSVESATLLDAGTYRCMVYDETETAGPAEFTVTVSDAQELPVSGSLAGFLLVVAIVLATAKRLREDSHTR